MVVKDNELLGNGPVSPGALPLADVPVGGRVGIPSPPPFKSSANESMGSELELMEWRRPRPLRPRSGKRWLMMIISGTIFGVSSISLMLVIALLVGK